jgi:acyl carrier protein
MRATNSDALVAEIVGVLRTIVYARDAAITAQTELADLGLDSLELMEAGLELEAVVGREFPDDALLKARTVGDVAACIADRTQPAKLVAA